MVLEHLFDPLIFFTRPPTFLPVHKGFYPSKWRVDGSLHNAVPHGSRYLFQELPGGEMVRLNGAEEPAPVQPLLPILPLPQLLYTHNVGLGTLLPVPEWDKTILNQTCLEIHHGVTVRWRQWDVRYSQNQAARGLCDMASELLHNSLALTSLTNTGEHVLNWVSSFYDRKYISKQKHQFHHTQH